MADLNQLGDVLGRMAKVMREENANDRVEQLAKEFYRDTGLTAPVKGIATAMGPVEYEERWRRWDEWLATREPRR